MRIEIKTSLEPTSEEKEKRRPLHDNNLFGIWSICQNCDTELYALWSVPCELEGLRFQEDREVEAIYKKEKEELYSARCPVCGAEIDKHWEHFSSRRSVVLNNDRRPIDIDWNIGYWRGKSQQKEKEAVSQKVQALLEELDEPITDKIGGPRDEICASPEKLKAYLSQLIRLEVNIYSLTKRLGTLYVERKQIGRRNNQELGMLTKEYRDALFAAEVRLKNMTENGVKVERPAEPTPPELKKPSFFNKAKVLAENEAATKQYNEAMAEYQRQMAACDAEEERLTKQAVSDAEEGLRMAKSLLEKKEAEADSAAVPSTALKISADHEIEEAEKYLRESLKARNELYSYNVVFGKYRDLVAISTFYEYLMAGRCTTLEGVNGAYNIYEAEIRANMIISQLTEIIKKLDQIKANQYTLYSELSKVNQNLSQISEKMDTAIQALDRIGDNTEQIAYNTEVTAFYAKKNAELTDALGYMVAFK